MADVIQKIQFVRGTKATLESRLVESDLGVLAQGEPAYETDTYKLKIGDGVSPYSSLNYIGGEGGGEDPRFVIQDPVANQVLLYDSSSGKWINKDLADEESIIYLAERGLTIKGYESASQGYMLVKDQAQGLAWIKPLDDAQLQEAVSSATQQAQLSGAYATQSGNSATEAATSAGNAERINQQTMSWVNQKFWWGTIDEYNALESINPGTFYFISAEK